MIPSTFLLVEEHILLRWKGKSKAERVQKRVENRLQLKSLQYPPSGGGLRMQLIQIWLMEIMAQIRT